MKDTLEASVEGAFITERLAKGSMHVRWMAKKIDYQTPMFNDSVVYREVSVEQFSSPCISCMLRLLPKVEGRRSVLGCHIILPTEVASVDLFKRKDSRRLTQLKAIHTYGKVDHRIPSLVDT